MSDMEPMIYMDNNATTAVAPECIGPITKCLAAGYGNPSSQHQLGVEAKELVMEARRQVAGLLGASPPEIVFTGCATEANHMAIRGALAARPERRHIVTSRVEHPSTLQLLDSLESQGVVVTRLPVDRSGRLDLLALQDSVTEDTALVSLMWANNETGVLFPIAEAAAIATAKGALFHTDAVQAVGKAAVKPGAAGVDLASLSGHKIHGPKGVGALYVRKGLDLPPQFFGHQERGRRGGTENVPAIVGFGVAAGLAARAEPGLASLAALRDSLEKGILERFPFAEVNGGGASRVANTTNIRFGSLMAEALLDRLDKAGICASSGAACTAGGTEPSHVLMAMGLDRVGALASIRFSLSRYTTQTEVDRVLQVLGKIVQAQMAQAA